MGDRRGANRRLVGRPGRKRPLGRLRCRCAGHVALMGERRGANSVWWEDLGERDHWEDLGVDAIIILK
jgi:hypothetical protein